MSVAFIAHWYPKPEMREQFIKVIGVLAAGFTPEIAAGIKFIQPAFNRDGEFIACEVWEDENALNTLRTSAFFHQAIRDMSACCSRPLELEHIDPLGSDGSIFERYPAGCADPRYYPDLGPMTPLFR